MANAKTTISVVLSREYFANLDPNLMEVIEEILEAKLPGSEVEVCVWAKSRADQPTIIQGGSEEQSIIIMRVLEDILK